MAHRAGIGVGVVLLIAVALGVVFVGYRFYSQTSKPFRFHYFKVPFLVLIVDSFRTSMVAHILRPLLHRCFF